MGMLMFVWALQALGSMSLNATTPSAQGPNIGQDAAAATENETLPSLINLPTGPPAAAPDINNNSEADDDEDDSDDEDGESDSYHSSDWDSDDNTVDEFDKALERKNRLVVFDADGELHWKQHESSYTDAEIRRRGEYSETCMYDTASPQELRKYVRDRGLPDPYPQGLTLKYLYIIALDQADRDKSFRFLDLPAEMRNLIYTMLLTFGRCPQCPRIHKVCHTGILQANKQVYKEARNILYDENEIHCTIGASGYDDDDPANLFCLLHVHETRGQKDSLDHVFPGMSQIPEWFRRIHRLRIDLSFSGGSVASAGFKLQTCLLNLASFLMDEHCLKKLKITIADSSEDEEGDGLDEFGDIIAARLDTVI